MDNYKIQEYLTKNEPYVVRTEEEIEKSLRAMFTEDFVSEIMHPEDKNLLDSIRAYKENKSSK
jgi:uncharacterized protein (DUF2164 family)